MSDQSKIPVSNYQYISYLVYNIKKLHAEKKDYDWYFNQFLTIYFPLIQSNTTKVHKKLKAKVPFVDVKTKVIEALFLAILKYKIKYTDESKHADGFEHVYFSKYLNVKLPWDIMRLYRPTKVIRDDFSIDPRHIELNLKKLNTEVQDRFECHNVQLDPISDNFVSLCCLAHKKLKNDVLSDIMFLHFGLDYRNSEIAELFNMSQLKVSLSLGELKKFWAKNKDLLIDE